MDIGFPQTLLLIGRDVFLLQTRRAVLKTMGFGVILAESASEARAAARHFRFQAILICHTFNTAEYGEMASSLRKLQNHVPVLRLDVSNVEPVRLIGMVQEVVSGLSHPKQPLGRLEDRPQQKAS